MATRKQQLKGRLRAWVTAGSSSDNYGFGSNWNLNIGKKDKILKSMWLGQGAKVTSRQLGMDYGDYIKQTTTQAGFKEKQWKSEQSWLGNKKINKIVSEDIIHSTFGDEWDSSFGGWAGSVDTKVAIKKLLKAQPWELSVQ